jgi:hypothetical protein
MVGAAIGAACCAWNVRHRASGIDDDRELFRRSTQVQTRVEVASTIKESKKSHVSRSGGAVEFESEK